MIFFYKKVNVFNIWLIKRIVQKVGIKIKPQRFKRKEKKANISLYYDIHTELIEATGVKVRFGGDQILTQH